VIKHRGFIWFNSLRGEPQGVNHQAKRSVKQNKFDRIKSLLIARSVNKLIAKTGTESFQNFLFSRC